MGITVVDVLGAISDARALAVYKTIASEKANSNLLITKMRLTRKQYYSRISRLIKTGLVKRENGRYTLTSFGKVIYDFQIAIEVALENFWKLKAIDSLQAADSTLSKEEQTRVLDVLIQNDKIKEVIFAKMI
jgi:nanoRNase/pAp phosphatase (c-di-AMP/oligoRNAs hydrolase)